MKLSIVFLEEIQDSDKVPLAVKQIIDILLLAINDWPKEILTVDDYEIEVKGFIKNSTTLDNIERALKKIDYSTESWESESLYQVKDVFLHYDEEIDLRAVIVDLKSKLKLT